MKHLKIISILSILFALSVANAETKVGGEVWADFQYVLDNSSGGTDDHIAPMGFDIRRARVYLTHSFNDTWSANFMIDGGGATTIDRAFLTGKNWLSDGHTMHIGLQKNAYKREWDKNNQDWIHRSIDTEIGGLIAGAFGVAGTANLDDFVGLNYNIAFNDMWWLEISLNQGPNAEIDNDGAAATNSDPFGYGLTVGGKINDNFNLMLAYDTFADYQANQDDSGNTNGEGMNVLRLNLNYTSDMIDGGFEYAMYSHNNSDVTATAAEDLGAMALNLNYKYQDNRSVYVYYLMTDGFDDSSYGATGVDNKLETVMKVGHVWNIDENIDTGVFYTATARDVDESDESAITWKWAANF